MKDRPIITVNNLKTYFYTNQRCNKAINGVSFKIKKGKTLCVVGESGCGKSVTASSIMQLLPKLSRIEEGEIIYHGDKGDIRIDKLPRNGKVMRNLRGKDIAMIFQDPMTALNPVYTVGYQITENILCHEKVSKKDAKERTLNLLKDMGIPFPEQRINEYPHQFSGGMRQRAMIAMAMSCSPKVLIADEPTTALDVTIQAQILELMRNLSKKHNTAILLITHDLGVVAEMADYVVVMYAGKVIEEGPVLEIFKNTLHEYTIGLLKSKPSIEEEKDELYAIPGQVPNPIGIKDSCYFSDRCTKCMDICRKKIPPLRKMGNNHKVACWLFENDEADKEESK